jgi:hypothetical protein
MERNIVCRIKSWLNAESKTGTALMGDDGPVTRKEVFLLNLIVILLTVGAIVADVSIVLTIACLICAAVLVKRLNNLNKEIKNLENHGK